METKITPFTPKNAEKFSCKKCNFTCFKISDWERHLSTLKHERKRLETFGNKKNAEKNSNQYQCENCDKVYKTRSGFWKHKKNCKNKKEDINEKNSDNNIDLQNISTNDMVLQLIKQNNELQKQITEIIPKIGDTNCNNTNKFNMNIFLNEKCKDAIPLMDFVNNLKLTIDDLDNGGEEGFVKCITDVFTRGLNQLDVTKRPIHCSDIKREILYVKNDDQWVKDDGDKSLVSGAINLVKKDADNFFHNYIKENPDCWKSGNSKNQQFMTMMSNRYGNSDNKINENNTKKVIKNIAKEVLIEKE